jgi:chemotaxis protein CheX
VAKFRAEKIANCFLIECYEDLAPPHIDELQVMLAEGASHVAATGGPSGNGAIILDLRRKHVMDGAFARLAAKVGQLVKIVLVQAPKDVPRFVGENGLTQVLRVLPDLPTALQQFPGALKARSGGKLDVSFVNPFVQGAIETLKVQCSMEIKPGRPFVKGKGPEISSDIAGVLGLTSQTFKGSIALVFPEKVFLAIMTNMLGEPQTAITKDLEDGAAELLNIIFGFAKRVLNDGGHTIEKALPSIVRGQGPDAKQLTPKTVIVLPFETPAGVFQIEVDRDS